MKRVLPAETASATRAADTATGLDDAVDAVTFLVSDAPSAVMGVYDEILRSLAQGEEIDSASALLAEKIRLLTDCSSSAIAFLDPEGETLTFTAAAGHESKELIGSRVHFRDTVLGKTAKTGEPYLAYRPRLDGLSSPFAEEMSSAAVIAIFSDGRPVGAVAALNKIGSRPFTSDDLMTLSTMAAAAAVVLRNTRLQSDSLRQGRELSTLYEAVRRVSGQLSVQEVLRAVVEQASAHIQNSAVVVFLTNDERTHLYIAEDAGLDVFSEQREVTLSAERGIGAAVLGKILPLELALTGVEDAEDSDNPLWTRIGETGPNGIPVFESPFPLLNARSGLAASIRSGDALHGFVLVLSGEPPGLFTKADSNLLSALASQAAVALENAWLYEDATRRAAEAATLYDLSQAVISTLRLPQVLDRIADSVLTLLDVDKFALFLQDSELQSLQMVVERGLPEGAAQRVQPGFGQGIPGWVMEFETPTAVQDVAADHRNASAPLHPEGVVSMTCMPLQSGISTIGVLCALSSRRRLFTVAEMELLYTIANQAATAIGNARIYADAQQKSRELRKYFHRVARALGSSRSPTAVPEIIVSLTQEITDSDYCALYSVRMPSALSPNAASAVPLQLVSEARVGLRTVDSVSPNGETPAQWVARRGRALSITNIETDSRFRDTALRPQRGKVISYLGVPLRGAGGRQDVVGVLEIYTRDRREWRTEEVRLLIAFASQAAVALRNAREGEQVAEAERRAEILLSLLGIAAEKPTSERAKRVLNCTANLFDSRIPLIAFGRGSQSDDLWKPLAAENANGAEIEAIETELNKTGIYFGVTSGDNNTYIYAGRSEYPGVSEAELRILQAAVDILAAVP